MRRLVIEVLRTVASIFLLLAVLAQTFSSFVYNAAYLLNKDYIASAFCENKAKPQMHCNGKCYLAKQQQEQKQEQQSGETKREKFEVQPFFLPEETYLTTASSKSKIIYDQLTIPSLSDYQATVFHPPAVSFYIFLDMI